MTSAALASQLTSPYPASNPPDDRSAAVVEDHEDNPVLEELSSLISELSVDEQIELVALKWLGRDNYSAGIWDIVRQKHRRMPFSPPPSTPFPETHTARDHITLFLSE